MKTMIDDDANEIEAERLGYINAWNEANIEPVSSAGNGEVAQHQVLHLVHAVADMLTRQVLDHPFVLNQQGLFHQAYACVSALHDLYQAVGQWEPLAARRAYYNKKTDAEVEAMLAN